MTAEQVKGYLKRIGYEGEIKLDEVGLDQLIWANLTNIPFENIDNYEKDLIPSLEIEDIYQKIVEKHRGGYCFELNKIFYDFLKSVGFDVMAVGVRIVWMKDFLPGMSHRAAIVTIGDKKYLADVGYGGPGPKGVLELTTGDVQEVRGSSFRVTIPKEGFYQVEREFQGGFAPMLLFEEKEAVEGDFGVMNVYCAKSPTVIFTQKYVINLCKEGGNIGLTGDELTIKDGDQITTEVIDTKEKRIQCLKEYFGIEY